MEELDHICPDFSKWEPPGLEQKDKFKKEFVDLMIKTWEAGFDPNKIIAEASENFDEFRRNWKWITTHTSL